ncbi:MAG TPA: Crp/Fnr family transcriptional regulator [Burkholderiaceae bacterium]
MSHTGIKPRTFLANLPLFKELAPAELDRIAAGTSELHVARGEILFKQGDPCMGLHVVVYGQVKLAFVSPEGSEKVVDLIGAGHSFGEALMFMDRPYVVMAQTLADSLLLHVSKHVIFEGIERDPAFARKMLAGLSRRLHGLIADLEAVSMRSGAQRVIGYLLRQDEAPAGQGGGSAGYSVTLPTSKAVIASRLNLTPEHFSRILHDLSQAGLIAVEARENRILDAERLRAHPG